MTNCLILRHYTFFFFTGILTAHFRWRLRLCSHSGGRCHLRLCSSGRGDFPVVRRNRASLSTVAPPSDHVIPLRVHKRRAPGHVDGEVGLVPCALLICHTFELEGEDAGLDRGRARHCHADALKCSWGKIHQFVIIILKLRILVLLSVSTMPYVVIVKNYS
jgi:hypothetical protein